MKPSNYTFTVSESDANFILNTLASQPYNVVLILLTELQRQANEQNAAATEQGTKTPGLAPVASTSEGAD